MPRRIKKYRGIPDAMFGPLYNAEDGGGGGVVAPPKPQAPEGAPKGGEQPSPKLDDEPLGEGGKKALEREREARKNLETQVNQMREAFSSALGIKSDTKADTDSLISQVQSQLATMQQQNLAERVARSVGITEEADVALLLSQPNEDAMRALAERIKPAPGNGTPGPDPSQGPKPEPPAPEPRPGPDRLRAAVTEALDEK